MKNFIAILAVLLQSLNSTLAFQSSQLFVIQKDSVCIGEDLQISLQDSWVNQTWDFCEGDLFEDPLISDNYKSKFMKSSEDLEFVQDTSSGKWYLFAISLSGELSRIDLGNNPQNEPLNETFINVTGLSSPRRISVINDEGTWYALVTNLGSNSLSLVDFGSNIENASPTVTDLGSFGVLNQPFALDIKYSYGEYIVLVGNHSNKKLSIINFGNSITNTPSSEDIIQTSEFPGDKLSDINAIQIEGIWYSLLVSQSDVFLLTFSDSLFSSPSYRILTLYFPLLISPRAGVVTVDAGKLFINVVEIDGKIHKAYLETIDQVPLMLATYEHPALTDTRSLIFRKYKSTWLGFSSNRGDSTLVRLDFKQGCSASKEVSNDSLPSGINYGDSGIKIIGLKVEKDNGLIFRDWDTVYVRAIPQPFFTSDFRCTQMATQFYDGSYSEAPITSYMWDFGDPTSGTENTSSLSEPSHQFTSAGDFLVSLTVTDECNQVNDTSIVISVYQANDIVPNFTTNDPVCSNSETSFIDQSTFNEDIKEWTWDLGDTITHEVNPVYVFDSAGSTDVTLTVTGVSGCSYDTTQTLSIRPGPATDFSFEDQCLGSEHQFTDLTTGENIIRYTWSFGDGDSAFIAEPVHLYEQTGTYDIHLAVENDTGCVTTKTKTTIVHAIPEADFTHDYSCNGLPTSFTDNSTVTDANITGWSWNFGDTIYNQENPDFVFEMYGIHPVRLTVESNYGCLDDTAINVTVNPSPVADFNIEACINKEASIENRSMEVEGNNIISWFWQIGDNTYTDSIPSHTFHTSGSHIVQLTIEASNLCAGQKEDTVYVDPPLNVGFSIDSPLCAGKEILFSDTTTLHNHLIEEWIWNMGGDDKSTTQGRISYLFPEPGEQTVRLAVNTENNCYYTSNPVAINIQPYPDTNFTTQFPEDSIVGAVPLKVELKNETTGAISYTWDMGDGSQFDFVDSTYTYTSEGEYLLSLKAYNESGCSHIFGRTLTVLEPYLDIGVSALTASRNNGWINFEIELVNQGHVIVDSLEIEIEMDKIESRRKEIFDGRLFVYPGTLSYHLSTQFPEFLVENQYVCVKIVPLYENLDDANPDNNLLCIDLTGESYFLNPYPNPSNDIVNIPFILPETGEITYTLTNRTGQLIMHRQLEALSAGYHTLLIDIRQFQGGMYILTLSYQDKKKSFRIFLDH